MQWALVYPISGEAILAGVLGEPSCPTQFARVTLRRESDGRFRIDVTSNDENLPREASQTTPVHASAARCIGLSEKWREILETAQIHLSGSAGELRCSIDISESEFEGKDESLLEGVTALANLVLIPAIGELLKVTVTPEFSEM